ncbi:MAG: AraC family transcriptional regulator [Clostridia bacterium]|nr:AraC family transcriptional regulator [Clostridia bacterium]
MRHKLIIHPDRLPEGPVLYHLSAGPMRYLKVAVQNQLVITSAGSLPSYMFILSGAPLIVGRGAGCLCQSNEARTLITLDPQSQFEGIDLTIQHKRFPLLCQIVIFQATYMHQMLKTIQPQSRLVIRDQSTEIGSAARDLLRQIELEQQQAAPGFDWMTRNIAAQLAILLIRQSNIGYPNFRGLTNHRGLQQRMPELLDYLKQHCARPLSLQVIAQRLGVNPSHLSRSFRQTFQITIRDYLIGCRLDLACQLLKNDSLLIGDIAQRCGYKTASRFSAMFLKGTGMRPIEYRRACLSAAERPPQLDRPGQLLYDHINIQEY